MTLEIKRLHPHFFAEVSGVDLTQSFGPEILTEIHLDYINSGSNIITANTYASSRIMLSAAGLDDHFNEININDK